MTMPIDPQKPTCHPRDYPGFDVYAVIGNPITHSRSPEIHALFAKQTNQNIHYGKLYSELDEFEETVNQFFEAGGKGLNVTVPFKTHAYALCEQLTERARAAAVVNVLWKEHGVMHGDNSDGIGLVRDLKRHLGSLKEKRILLLGAGGAAQGVVLPLIKELPTSLLISNRTFSKAESLVQQFNALAIENKVQLASAELEKIHTLGTFDVVINATASSLDSKSPLTDDLVSSIVGGQGQACCAYDMLYGKQTLFMRQFAEQGTIVLDGLGMLVEQAAQAFETWRGPSVVGKLDVESVIKHLKQR